jgi:DNA-directed RNA polymerase subunit K/omega
MSIKPLSIRDIEEKTLDIYEAVVVMSQRTKQIIQDRMIQKALDEVGTDDLGVFDTPEEKNPEDYVEMEKASTIAIKEFLDGKITWHKAEDEK